MNIDIFDKKFENLTNQEKSKQKEMEEIRIKIIDAINQDSFEWSKNQLEDYIVHINPEITLLHDDRTLINLKKEFNDLIDKISSLTEDNLSQKKLWIHEQSHNSIIEFYSQNYTNNFEKNIKQVIRTIRGYSGQILKKYGYLDQSRPSNWSFYTNGLCEYNQNFKFNDEIKEHLEKYQAKNKDLKKIIEKIELTEKDKTKYQAESRWNSIKIS